MIIWIVLFVVTILISLILAFRSMSDYYEKAANFSSDNSIFLIGKPESLTAEFIKNLHAKVLKDNVILSFERLFKGSKRAMVVYGPTSLLRPYFDTLGLVELEDYSLNTNADKILAWEVGLKNSSENIQKTESLVTYIPALEEEEEFWWQMILNPKKERTSFQVVIRAVLKSSDLKRAKYLEENLVEIGSNIGLAQLPQAYSNTQFLKFYQERAMPKLSLYKLKEKELYPVLEADDIVSLIGLKQNPA